MANDINLANYTKDICPECNSLVKNNKSFTHYKCVDCGEITLYVELPEAIDSNLVVKDIKKKLNEIGELESLLKDYPSINSLFIEKDKTNKKFVNDLNNSLKSVRKIVKKYN